MRFSENLLSEYSISGVSKRLFIEIVFMKVKSLSEVRYVSNCFYEGEIVKRG